MEKSGKIIEDRYAGNMIDIQNKELSFLKRVIVFDGSKVDKDLPIEFNHLVEEVATEDDLKYRLQPVIIDDVLHCS